MDKGELLGSWPAFNFYLPFARLTSVFKRFRVYYLNRTLGAGVFCPGPAGLVFSESTVDIGCNTGVDALVGAL